MESMFQGLMPADKASNFICQVMIRMFLIAMRPLMLLTEVFYRRDFGERYFRFGHLVVGLIILWGATIGARDIPVVFANGRGTAQVYTLKPALAYWVGGAWASCLVLSFAVHQIRLAMRTRRGILWHSESPGVPFVRAGSRFAARALPVILLVFAAIFLRPFMLFVSIATFSQILSMNADENARKALHNRVLDMIDAEIEAKVLHEALGDHKAGRPVLGIRWAQPKWVPAGVRETLNAIATMGMEGRASHSFAGARSRIATSAVVVEPKPEPGNTTTAGPMDTAQA